MNDELVCSVFVDARALSRESLAEVLACCDRVRAGGLDVEIRERKPEEIVSGLAFPDDFLGFALVVELYGFGVCEALVDAAAHVLRTVWSHGVRAVASCDFEHVLPNAGGLLYRPEPDRRAGQGDQIGKRAW